METGKTNSTKNYIIDKLQLGDELENDYKKIAETFNTHFTLIADTITVKNNPNTCNTNKTTPFYHLLQSFSCTFPNLNLYHYLQKIFGI